MRKFLTNDLLFMSAMVFVSSIFGVTPSTFIPTIFIATPVFAWLSEVCWAFRHDLGNGTIRWKLRLYSSLFRDWTWHYIMLRNGLEYAIPSALGAVIGSCAIK